ncbi:MAG: hypothetical protein R3C44_23575 [Chloroflexota bacterium]
MIVLILKLLIVLVFLIMFLRRPSVTWGVGLLTVTTAVLLDTFLGTFNREDMLAQFGFFYYVVAGALFAGAAFWLWGVLRNYLPTGTAAGSPSTGTSAPAKTTAVASATVPVIARAVPPEETAASGRSAEVTDAYAAAGYDRQMLHDQIHDRFGREELADLVFDLELNEMDVMPPGAGSEAITVNIIDAANREEKVAALALATERILTPPPTEHLPRLEKLSVDSPRPVLRYFLLSNYDLSELRTLATAVGIDWEQLPQRNKRTLAREMLLYVDRRGKLEDLLVEMQQMDAGQETS